DQFSQQFSRFTFWLVPFLKRWDVAGRHYPNLAKHATRSNARPFRRDGRVQGVSHLSTVRQRLLRSTCASRPLYGSSSWAPSFSRSARPPRSPAPATSCFTPAAPAPRSV